MGATIDEFPIIVLEPTTAALRSHIEAKTSKTFLDLLPSLDAMKVVRYHEDTKTPDPRIGWDDTMLVTCDGWGVIGYVDEMPT